MHAIRCPAHKQPQRKTGGPNWQRPPAPCVAHWLGFTHTIIAPCETTRTRPKCAALFGGNAVTKGDPEAAF